MSRCPLCCDDAVARCFNPDCDVATIDRSGGTVRARNSRRQLLYARRSNAALAHATPGPGRAEVHATVAERFTESSLLDQYLPARNAGAITKGDAAA